MDIDTDQEGDQGTYRIRITANIAAQALTDSTEFDLVVFPGDCLTESVSPDSALGPVDYVIGQGLLALEPTWTSSVAAFACPAAYRIYFDVGGAWQPEPLPAITTNVLFFKDANGFLDVETTDIALDQETFYVRLTKESIYSELPQDDLIGPLGIYRIYIHFIDPCWLATITPAFFDDSSLTYSLFEFQEFFLTNMEVSIDCGGVTQELVYKSGLLAPSADL